MSWTDGLQQASHVSADQHILLHKTMKICLLQCGAVLWFLITDVSKHCGIFVVYLLEIHDLEIKALRFSETSGPTYPKTWLQIPGKLIILQ